MKCCGVLLAKTTAHFLKEEIKSAAGPLQVCTGLSARAEAAIHTTSQVYEEEETYGILLIDATNALNQMNRAVATHNIQISCPLMSKYIIYTYRSPSAVWLA